MFFGGLHKGTPQGTLQFWGPQQKDTRTYIESSASGKVEPESNTFLYGVPWVWPRYMAPLDRLGPQDRALSLFLAGGFPY